jgi:hypothetical protein
MKKERSKTWLAIPAMIAAAFLMILDNVLTVCETAGGKRELAGLSLNQEASQKELDEV